MLQELHISNYALIDSLHVNFHKGFNIITGETGAGKSIILGALGLLMGQRADLNALRDKQKKCVIEACFSKDNNQLETLFEANDLDYEEQILLRREINVKGKSRAFINDTPVTLKVMQEVSAHLIDIHSQHQNLSLGSSSFQFDLVDQVANLGEALKEYTLAYSELKKLKDKHHQLVEKAEKDKNDIDYIQFQFNQLEEAALKEEEQDELEKDKSTLENAEEINAVLGGFVSEAEESEQNMLGRLREQASNFSKIAEFIPEAQTLSERLNSTYIELQDICAECSQIAGNVEYDQAQLSFINERLNTIYELEHKFKVDTIKELLDLKEGFENKLLELNSYDGNIKELEESIKQLETEVLKQASLISEKRQTVAPKIESHIVSVLQRLGMNNAAFKIAFQQMESPTANGIDVIKFTFSSNKSSELQDVAKVASGGEISRVMLAIKSIIASNKALPTIIFDEIDTGISGEVAVKMGDIIKDMSSNVQILNITHLPQIAGKGDHHFKVYKFDDDDATYTSIRELNEDERIEELAQMLGGDKVSETARKAAKELLNLT